MGANASTAVPLYASGQVLDAARLNLTNSGIPVFSGTATRDAAFGGSGEKILAEGQVVYLEDTDALQYYSGTSFVAVATPSGVIQVKSTSKTDTFTLSSATFTDITGLSVSITPTSATNKILVMVSVNTGGAGNVHMRLMRDSTAIGIADTSGSRIRTTLAQQANYDANMITSGAANFLDSPATTSATTYKLQISGPAAAQTTINRTTNNNDNTSTANTISTITVMEVTP
jgi:hypothetical protein